MTMDLRTAAKLIESAQQIEKLQMTALPYKLNALEPCMSKNCVDVHYNTLTKKYFTKYEETGDLFQKAGAVLHNDHYWPLMQSYNTKSKLPSELLKKIDQTHGSLAKFKDAITQAGMGIQGNGWVFIMQDLQIQTVQNHVIKDGIALAVDVWEHATVDHDFNREKFFSQYWNVINWEKLLEKVN